MTDIYALRLQVLEKLLASSCFCSEVCQHPPCACANEMAETLSPLAAAYSQHNAEIVRLRERINSLEGVLMALQLQALQSSVNDPANEWGRDALARTKSVLADMTKDRKTQ